MNIFGWKIERALSGVPDTRGSWYPAFSEPFGGAWQRNITVNQTEVLAFHAIFACMTLIASDISKLRVKLVGKESSGIWTETTSASFSPVLRKPNDYQTRIQFWESWILSKLSKGNTYILKQRDNRNVVTKMYLLDPSRVRPLISDDGEIYYQLQNDNLSGIKEQIIVPASEIIHDRFNCLFHPMIGISPIYAAGLAATQGLKIQNNSTVFFANGSKPGGILTAPGKIGQENADRLKAYWDQNFSGDNAGKIAVLGDGLKYEGLSVDPKDAELVSQLKWSAEVVCSAFHVPPYKVGIGTMPTYNNIQSLNVEYYSQCLQSLIESAEICLDEGLGIGDGVAINGATYGTEFDLDNLLRMDAVSQMDVLEKSKGKLTVNEQRARLDKGPVEGGDTVYLQEQDHSLAWLSRRDSMPVEQPVPPANDNAAQKALLEKTIRGLLDARRQ